MEQAAVAEGGDGRAGAEDGGQSTRVGGLPLKKHLAVEAEGGEKEAAVGVGTDEGVVEEYGAAVGACKDVAGLAEAAALGVGAGELRPEEVVAGNPHAHHYSVSAAERQEVAGGEDGVEQAGVEGNVNGNRHGRQANVSLLAACLHSPAGDPSYLQHGQGAGR